MLVLVIEGLYCSSEGKTEQQSSDQNHNFFRNDNGITNSMRRLACVSLRKRTVSREVRSNSVMSCKPKLSELAWWQQASTDMSSDQEED